MAQDRGQTRVVIIDDHTISRAACRALLRTEGLEVLADLDGDERALTAVRALAPDIVLVDVTPGDPIGIALARRIEALTCAPRVVLTSCAERDAFGAGLDGIAFVGKGDVCAEALMQAPATPTGS
jgi:DNA-binding NarL/FixJ family response regulator